MVTARDDIPPASDADGQGAATIDTLIDRAVSAINRGDRPTATALADRVLAVDKGNADAEDLLAAPVDAGEIRRLTILFADLVDSTALSTRVEPETYHSVVRRYRDQVRHIVAHYEGHISGTSGDGILAVFGHPVAHEDDARRAVLAGVEIVAEVARISGQARRRYGIDIDVRVGVHRGLVYLDTTQDDVYGLAANLAARVSGLAPPGSVVLSAAVKSLVNQDFELDERPAAPVKGLQEPVSHSRVLGPRLSPCRPNLTPLVGRHRERALLQEKWSRAQTGELTEPGLLFVGEPGIGKSRLTAEAIDLVRRSGGPVVELAGSPYHVDVGFHPIRALLERHCGIARHTPIHDRLRLLQHELRLRAVDPDIAIPTLAPVLSIGPEHGYEPVAAEGRRLGDLITSSVRSYLLACLTDNPALLVAEDLHWFDPSTLDVLGSVLGGGEGRLLAVFTSRDRPPLSAPWQLTSCELEPLSDHQTDELIVALDPTLSPGERAKVRARCDGVPFYVEQVVADMQSVATGDRRIPDALYEPLFARLRADKQVVPVVEAAAVIGRHVDRALLAAVVDLDDDELDRVIEQLAGARVLEPSGPDLWRFRHELLREVVDELAPPTVRRRLHRRVADALVAGSTADPDWQLVASHYHQAGLHTDAATAYQRATSAARQRGALAEARTLLTHALDQLEQCPPGPERDRREIAPRLERGYLTATAEGAQSSVAVGDFERCLVLAGTDLRDDELVATLAAVGAYYVWRSDLHRADQLLELVRQGTEYGERWFRPAIDSATGIVAWLRGDFDTARAHFHQAASGLPDDYERKIQDMWSVPHDPVALAREHLAWDCLIRGDVSGAEAQLSGAIDRASHLGYPQQPYNRLYAIDMEIWVRTEAGQYDRARDLAGKLVEHAERDGLDHLYWQLLGATEKALVDAHQSAAAPAPDPATLDAQIAELTGVIEVWQALGASTYRPFYWCALGRLLTTAGQPDQARPRLEAALQFTADSGVHFYDAELLRAVAHTHSDPSTRSELLARARDLARSQGAFLFELRAGLDDLELRGVGCAQARQTVLDAAAKLPADSPLPELSRARALIR